MTDLEESLSSSSRTRDGRPQEINGRSQKALQTPPCDQCRYRKVRCNKILPSCRQCADAGLTCTRDVIRRRPGRKKGSGHVLSRLRLPRTADSQRSALFDNPRPTVHLSSHSIEIPMVQWTTDGNRRKSDDAAHSGPGFSDIDRLSQHTWASDGSSAAQGFGLTAVSPERTPHHGARRSTEAFESSDLQDWSYYVDQFFNELHPIWPILHESSVRQSLQRAEPLDHHQKCLILSICALAALHVPSPTPVSCKPRKVVAQCFIDHALRLRASVVYIETATISTIQTSLFLSCAEIEFQRTRSSLFLLRESIMLAQELGCYEATRSSAKLSQAEFLSLQRTLYLLSLTERGLTILRNKPFTIMSFESPPEERFENEDPCIAFGLQTVNRLFDLLNEQFLTTWVDGSESTTPAQATAQVLATQQTLASMRFDLDSLIDVQKADILVTHQWVRLIFWQSSMRQGLLSSAAEDPALSYHFPCHIAKSLCAILESLPKSAIFVHGVAIVSPTQESSRVDEILPADHIQCISA